MIILELTRRVQLRDVQRVCGDAVNLAQRLSGGVVEEADGVAGEELLVIAGASEPHPEIIVSVVDRQ